MKIIKFVFSVFSENTYLLYDSTNECIIIDAGNYTEQEGEEIVSFIEVNNLKPVKIIGTHCHLDHIFGVVFLQNKYKIPYCANKIENFYLIHAPEAARRYGLHIEAVPKIDVELSEKDIVRFGNTEIKILEVPGHTSGHLAFYNENEKVIFTGDVLFRESIGRTDLPGGNYETLIKSIKEKILILDDDYKVYAGHMSETTIGYEKENNSFLQ